MSYNPDLVKDLAEHIRAARNIAMAEGDTFLGYMLEMALTHTRKVAQAEVDAMARKVA